MWYFNIMIIDILITLFVIQFIRSLLFMVVISHQEKHQKR